MLPSLGESAIVDVDDALVLNAAGHSPLLSFPRSPSQGNGHSPLLTAATEETSSVVRSYAAVQRSGDMVPIAGPSGRSPPQGLPRLLFPHASSLTPYPAHTPEARDGGSEGGSEGL